VDVLDSRISEGGRNCCLGKAATTGKGKFADVQQARHSCLPESSDEVGEGGALVPNGGQDGRLPLAHVAVMAALLKGVNEIGPGVAMAFS
jgi:hypothetical protein